MMHRCGCSSIWLHAAIHGGYSHRYTYMQATLSKVRLACEKLERRAQAWSFVEKMRGAGSDEQRHEIKLSTVEGLIFAQVCVGVSTHLSPVLRVLVRIHNTLS
jgi:hypothetical protein